jgi:hypothetical protein
VFVVELNQILGILSFFWYLAIQQLDYSTCMFKSVLLDKVSVLKILKDWVYALDGD